MPAKYIELYLNSSNIIKGHCFVIGVDKGIESKNYFIYVGNKNNLKYILKIYSESKDEELKYEIEILNNLNLKNNNKFFPEIQKEFFYINKRPSIILKYIKGHVLTKKELSPFIIKKIARKQAKMHLSLINFIPKHKKNRFSIFDFSFVSLFLKNNKNSYYSVLKNEVKILKQESKSFIETKFKKSVIHEDLTSENIILTKKGGVNFIDFGESHRAEIISDIAIVIKEIIINNKGVNFGLIRDYLNSYQKIIRLSNGETGALLFLLKRRTVFMLAYYLGRYEINNSIKFKRKIVTEVKVLKILQKNSCLIKNFINRYNNDNDE